MTHQGIRYTPTATQKSGLQEQVRKTLCLFLFALLFLSMNTHMFMANSDTTEIKILATSDMHNTFYPHDYALDRPYALGGLPRVASAIAAVRTKNTILIDNGDTIQGVASRLNLADAIHPMIIGLNALEYDVWNSGNHEFNYGIPLLEQVVATFNGRFLLANVYDHANDRIRGATNYTIIERSGIKVAIIGVVTPNIQKWDRANLAQYRVTDPKAEVAQAVAEIHDGDLADITVVAFHASVDGEYGSQTDSAAIIAQEVPHIDAIIAGHQHAVIGKMIEGKEHPIPVVEPGRFGDYVSEINFNVRYVAGKYQIVDYDKDVTFRNIKTADYPNDPFLLQRLQPFHERAVMDARTIIGELRDGPLVAPDEIKGIPQAQIVDTPLIDFILKVQTETVEAQGIIPRGARHVSGTALFKEDANMQQGPITKASATNIYKFDNTLMSIKTTGLGLKNYMEWSAGYYNTFTTGDLTISFNPAVRIYNYDMFSGVRYHINISKPVGSRIERLQYMDGTPVRESDEVYVTVNNYRANTHLLLSLLPAGAEVVYDSTNEAISTVRDKIVAYIEDVQVLYPTVDDNWQLTGYAWNKDLHKVVQKLVNRGDLSIPKSIDARTPNIRSMQRSDIILAANVIDLLAVNDFHGAVEENGKNIGGAKLGSVINAKKTENKQTMLLGGGDLFQGSALSNLTKGEVVAALLQAHGMVYSAVGNHEFDWGVELIPQLAKKGNFQFLAANIAVRSKQQKDNVNQSIPPWAKPYGLASIGGKKIGFIGLTTPDTAYQTDPKNVKDLVFLDPVQSAIKWERYLRRTEKVDLVFALSHIGSNQVGQKISGAAADLAKQVPNLDGIFSAHSHQFVAGNVGSVPIVQGGFNGRGIATMSVIYTKDGEQLAIVPTFEDLSQMTNQLNEDQLSQKIIVAYREQLAPILNEVIGFNAQDLPHEHTGQSNLTMMGQATAKMMSEMAGVDIALINGGGIRAGLKRGNITVADMYALFPFDNTLVSVDVSGAQLIQLIQHGINTTSFRPGQFYGLTVWYRKAANGLSQVSEMRLLNGEKIRPRNIYRIATVDFLVAGGDYYDFTGASNIRDTRQPLREKLSEYIKRQGGIRHNFVQTLIQGSPLTISPEKPQTPNTLSPDKSRYDKLPHTGKYQRELVSALALFVALTLWRLKQHYHNTEN